MEPLKAQTMVQNNPLCQEALPTVKNEKAGVQAQHILFSRILQIIRGIPQMCSSGTSYEPQPDEEQSTMGYPKMMSSSTSTYTCSVGVGTSTYISTSVQVRTKNQAWANLLNYFFYFFLRKLFPSIRLYIEGILSGRPALTGC